jgi:hypothetical protein
MSEQVYIAAVIISGACLIAVLLTAMFALWLGRGLRAQGVARIGEHGEFSVCVEVPAAVMASSSGNLPRTPAPARATLRPSDRRVLR